MLFNSYIFILCFLPLTLLGWYFFNRLQLLTIANVFLIGMSLWFYGYFNPSYLLIICTSIIANYLLSRILSDEKYLLNARKMVLIAGILANLGCLFYFKYCNFFLENINIIFAQSFNLKNIVLPLGISFFTFQQIAYLVDAYRGETKSYGVIEYALFVSFFPRLASGPIVLHGELIPQFKNTGARKFTYENFSKGIYIFALGLFKKVLIADTFGKAVAWGYGAVGDLSSLEALLVSISYTLQLYFDFSGYCDMAIGIGNMFNIELPQNFNSPYKATSIVDFWDRWHMSLTRFLRQYIYFPLGGSRKGTARTYVNIMIVFLVSGIWHGANWTFILWGILHGALNCLNRMFMKGWKKLGRVINWFLTFMCINFLWVIFRAENISQAGEMIGRIVAFDSWTISKELLKCYKLTELTLAETHIKWLGMLNEHMSSYHMWLWFIVAFIVVLCAKNSGEIKFRPTFFKGIITILFLVWSIMSLSGISTFLYVDF